MKGTFKARPVGPAQFGETGTGKDQVAVTLEILEGEAKGQRFTWFGFFTDAATDIALKALRAMGWKGEDIIDCERPGVLNKEVNAVLDEDEYKGKKRTKVNFVNSLDGIELKKKMGSAQKASFAERIKARVVAQAVAEPESSSGSEDDDTPF